LPSQDHLAPDESARSSVEHESTPVRDDLSIAEMLRCASRGDEIAFAQMYDATSSRVYGHVLRLVRNRAIGDEVTQEVYLQAWQSAARFDETRGSALTWLMTLAHRRAVDRIRSVEAASRRDEAYHRQIDIVEHDVTAAAAEMSAEADRVRSALAALSAVQRQVIELAYFQGHTHSEIALIAGIPVGTAKSRIRDGLLRMRDLVAEAA